MAKGRYTNVKILKNNKKNKQYINTIIYPQIVQQQSDTYIVASRTDRLDLLADKYYGDSNLYWIISLANNIISDSFFVEPGIQLCIPAKDRISNIFTEIQNLNE